MKEAIARPDRTFASEPLLSAITPLARSVVVVSVGSGPTSHGMTADSFSTVSEDPALVTVAVVAGGRTHCLLAAAAGFAVSVLAEEQDQVAAHFASRRRPIGIGQFDLVDWKPAPTSGAPVLTEALMWLDCSRSAMTSVGDHVLVVGTVLAAAARYRPGRPLVRFDGAYQALRPRLG